MLTLATVLQPKSESQFTRYMHVLYTYAVNEIIIIWMDVSK